MHLCVRACVCVCVPAPNLDSMPRGVTLRDPINMARDIPGASRSITSLVAWGERERREREREGERDTEER